MDSCEVFRKALVALVGAFALSATVSADTWTWTGAQDNCWTNPANWTVGGSVPVTPPGWYNDAYGATGELDSVAEFGSVSSDEVTIDMSGLLDIHTITVTANTTTKYTFGTEDQSFTLHATSGVFRVESGARAPYVAAKFGALRFPQNTSVTSWNVNSDAATEGQADFSHYSPQIENNSSETLEFRKFFWNALGSSSPHTIVFKGTGDIRLSSYDDTYASTASSGYVYLQQTGSKLILDDSTKRNLPYSICAHRLHPAKVEIGAGCTITAHNQFFKVGRGTGSLTVSGEGSVLFPCNKKSSSKTPPNAPQNGGYVYVPTGSTLTFDVNLKSEQSSTGDFYGSIYPIYYQGNINIRRPTELRGFIHNLSAEAFRINVNSLGLGETPGALGYGGILVAQSCRLTYTGTGETTDRAFCVTNSASMDINSNAASRNPIGELYHNGSGKLVWNGFIGAPGVPVNQASSYPRVRFAVKSGSVLEIGEPIGETMFVEKVKVSSTSGADAGTLRFATNCVYRGSTVVSVGTVSFAPGVAPTNSSSISLSGNSSLVFEGDGTIRSFALPPITVVSGANTIRAENGSSLVITSLTYTAGSLDVSRRGRATVKITDPNLVGTSPSWLKFAGGVATIGADGEVVPMIDGTSIAARGDQVPDSPGGLVAVVNEGSGGNDTLAAPAVSVGELRQMAAVEATVALAEGETLKASKIAIADCGSSLALGDVAGRGKLNAAGDAVELCSDNENAVLDVKAAIASTNATVSKGSVTLSGGSENTVVRVTDGLLKFTGENPFGLSMLLAGVNIAGKNPRVAIDGAKNVVLATNLVFAVGSGGNDPIASGTSTSTESNWSVSSATTAHMVITNSTIVEEQPADAQFSQHNCRGAICVGHTGYGILDICAGSCVTSRLAVGCGTHANTKSPFGAVYQAGGEMHVWGYDSKDYPGFPVGLRSGMGYYRLYDGRLEVLSGSIGIGVLGRGVFNMSGGELRMGKKTFGLGRSNGGHGLFRMSGGTATVGGVWCSEGSTGSYGSILLEGDSVFTCQRVYGAGGASGTRRSEAHLNINGNAVFVSEGAELSVVRDRSAVNRCFAIGFNGGTFKMLKSGLDIFYPNTAYDTYTWPTNIYVYAGGAVFDTGTNNAFTAAALKAPEGNGLVSVDYVDNGTTYLSEPLVRIVGDGNGATAVAEYDPETRRVTSVRVTSSGSGYTTATAQFFTLYTGASKEVSCTLGPVSSGGITKKGIGQFSLSGVNTYAGPTRVAEGTLVLDSATALPAGSDLVFAGGTVEATNASYFPSSILIDYDIPDSVARVTLARFPNGTPAAVPELRGVSDMEWRLKFVGNQLKMVRQRGVIMILR